MLVPNRWRRRRRANLVDPLLNPVALREARDSRERNLDSRERNLGSRERNPSPVSRGACPNRRAVNRRVGRELQPQLLSSRLGTFR